VNMLEWRNEEIRRRTSVVRIFPNAVSCCRLVRALETHENWLEAHRYLNMEDLKEHKKSALRKAASPAFSATPLAELDAHNQCRKSCKQAEAVQPLY
jgi:Transposase, Mutator family